MFNVIIKNILCCYKNGYSKKELSDFIDKLESKERFEEIDLL